MSWKTELYKKAVEKDFETEVNNLIGLIEKFSSKFDELASPIKKNSKHVNVENNFDIKKEAKIYDGSFVPKFTIHNTTLKVNVSFLHKIATFDVDGRSLLNVRIDSMTGARIVGEPMDRPLTEHDFEVLLEKAFSNSIK
ncbi:hypothetical protein [Lysinibacillus fusiformis]|uniref:hypothetical protein n=1 Tax=Lysinibacillus fusiformis TaxID=28031 RepID=UPI00364D6F34